jgi:hypothetical protein
MSGLYFTDLLDLLVAAGCVVGENSTTNGWQTRARSSGGFPAMPLCCFWHHTASNTSPANDLNYMIDGCDDAPVGNMLIDRDGVCWPIAAGASNCAGKGGPNTLSRGTIPLDGGNTRGWQIECASNGVGGPWPEVQVSALIAASNAMNRRFGNLPSDVLTHALGAGDGWTNRKIDPATAAAVQGMWLPRSTNSSGTWSLADIRNECAVRAGQAPGPTPIPPTPVPPEPTPVPPTPTPTPPSEDWMANLPSIKKGDSGPYVERMQHLLAAAGFMDPANVKNYDGVWGNGTDNAKANFDNEHGLTPSPPTDCGAKSWESLMTGKVW